MRQKILIITNCIKCNHIDCIEKEGIFCGHPSKKFKALREIRIEDIRTIPKWCPLEDAKIEKGNME